MPMQQGDNILSDDSEIVTSPLRAVVLVGLLTYSGEYVSFLVILALVQDKLVLQFQLGVVGAFVVGIVSGAYLVLSGLFAIPLGRLADRYGRRVVAVAGATFGALSMLLMIVSSYVPDSSSFLISVAGSLCALGFGHATYTASTWAYVGDIARGKNLGRSYGLLEISEYGAFAFGPGIGILTASIVGRLPTFALSALLMFAASLIAFLGMAEPTKPSPTQEESLTASGGPKGVPWNDFAAVLRNPVVTATLLTTFFTSLALQAFYIYVPLYSAGVTNVLGPYGAAAGFLSTVAAGTSILMMVPFGFAVDATERRMPWLILGLLVGSSSLVLVYLSHTFFLLGVAATSFGVGLASARVSQAVILAERSSAQNRATVMGTNHAVEHAGYGVGALTGGILISLYGFNNTFRDLAFLLMVAAAAFFFFSVWKGAK